MIFFSFFEKIGRLKKENKRMVKICEENKNGTKRRKVQKLIFF